MKLGAYADLSPEKTLEIVLQSIGELINYELAVVLGYDGTDKLTVRTSMGPLANELLSSFSISLTKRPDLAALLAGGKPRLFSEEEKHVDTYDEILDLPDGHSCLAAPLIADGVPIGLLTLDHRSCGVFSREILRFIGVISRLIAIALSQTEASKDLRAWNATLIKERNRLLSESADVFKDLAGTSPSWSSALESLKLVAASDSPVLILGETGTGKEESARAIHRLSDRADGPFIALNCSALPASLAESELFGHEKGSFTGAQALRKGRFELADGGTLFLDEIGDLPMEIQPKLLRALQEGSFERVGGERPISVNVRIVAATHVDLAKAVAEGKFREDLYYRIAVFPIRLPPLRERGQDTILLAELFAQKLRSRSGWENLRFSSEALDRLLSNAWPGNVRELRNVVERAAILARGGLIGVGELGPGEWVDRCVEREPRGLEQVSAALGGDKESVNGAASEASLDDALRRHIEAVLARTGGKIYGMDGAAAMLGLKPSTLQSKMKRLGIMRRGSA